MKREFEIVESSIPGETQYLIESLNELVNETVDEYLDGNTTLFTVTEFHPESVNGKPPIGVRRLENNYLTKSPRDFTNIDLRFNFPIGSSSNSPFNIAVNWSDGMRCRLAIIDKRPFLTVERQSEDSPTYHSEPLDKESMWTYVNSLGLPKSIWGANMRDIVSELSGDGKLSVTREASVIVDPYTTIDIVHDAKMLRDNEDKQHLIQELLININHFLRPESQIADDTMKLKPFAAYRNMLRFERSEDGSLWEYRGAYSGKLTSGDTVESFVQVDPKLGVPDGKLLDKALNTFSNHPY